MIQDIILDNVVKTELLAQSFSKVVTAPLIVYLQGDLGSGKTTFVRAYLQAMGFTGHVKSPTYNLLEQYNLTEYSVLHFDLYRFSQPEEWLDSGFDDVLNEKTISFIEWPDCAYGYGPNADIILKFIMLEEDARQVSICEISEKGSSIVDLWRNLLEDSC